MRKRLKGKHHYTETHQDQGITVRGREVRVWRGRVWQTRGPLRQLLEGRVEGGDGWQALRTELPGLATCSQAE